MTRVTVPNKYNLGGTVDLLLTAYDHNDLVFTPVESRLSVKSPDGNIFTVSGAGLSTASGYLYYTYRPLLIGWYEYEGWVKDANGREIVVTKGFDITDRLY